MWRDYYDGQWIDLSAGLMELAKDQFGFSTDESVRMAMSAGQAAMLFRSNPADPRCQEQLQTFYRIVQSRSASEFSVEKAAELELTWWRKRRENAPAADYASDIAALSEMLFGLPKNATLPAALIRVEAMVYRDERRDGLMTDADWEHIHRRLQVAYQKLHEAIHDAPE